MRAKILEMSDSNNRDDNDGDVTRIINPATDTLKIDLELAKATDPVLILIRGGLQGKKFSLQGNSRFVMGRDKGIQIQVDDANVSRQHAQITREGDRVFIEDMGSRNGTFVNDVNIGTDRRELGKEDMIKLGSTILKYLPAGQLETLYHINLTNAAYIDKLTGLYNRKYISEVLEVEFKRARSLHSPLSVVMFDIDHFKKVNDTYGHDGGDYVLSDLGKQVKSAGLRERDLCGRYGGEEFMIVLTGSTAQEGMDIAERLRKRIQDHLFVYDGTRVAVTISMGVAELTPSMTDFKDIYRASDKALYVSKQSGRNRVTLG
jgi:two-component system cell cycle response regulator